MIGLVVGLAGCYVEDDWEETCIGPFEQWRTPYLGTRVLHADGRTLVVTFTKTRDEPARTPPTARTRVIEDDGIINTARIIGDPMVDEQNARLLNEAIFLAGATNFMMVARSEQTEELLGNTIDLQGELSGDWRVLLRWEPLITGRFSTEFPEEISGTFDGTHFWLVWSEPTVFEWRIQAMRVTPDGEPVDLEPFTVITGDFGKIRAPRIAVAGQAIWVVWDHIDTREEYEGRHFVQGALLDRDGGLIAGPIHLIERVRAPMVASLGDEVLVAAPSSWSDNIRWRRLGQTGPLPADPSFEALWPDFDALQPLGDGSGYLLARSEGAGLHPCADCRIDVFQISTNGQLGDQPVLSKPGHDVRLTTTLTGWVMTTVTGTAAGDTGTLDLNLHLFGPKGSSSTTRLESHPATLTLIPCD